MFSTQIEIKAHVVFDEPVGRDEFESRIARARATDMVSYSGEDMIKEYIVSPGGLPVEVTQHIVRDLLEPGERAVIDLYEVELEPVHDHRLTALGAVYRSDSEAA